MEISEHSDLVTFFRPRNDELSAMWQRSTRTLSKLDPRTFFYSQLYPGRIICITLTTSWPSGIARPETAEEGEITVTSSESPPKKFSAR